MVKHAETLMRVNVALAFGFGLGFAAWPGWMLELLPFFTALHTRSGPMVLFRLLGALLAGTAVVLWIVPPVRLDPARRWLVAFAGLSLFAVWISLPLVSQARPEGRLDSFARLALFLLLPFAVTGVAGFALRALSGRTEEARPGDTSAGQERSRLAKELHDSIQQQLFSIQLGSAAAEERWESDPGGARTALAEVRRSSQEALVEMQALLAQLRPEPLAAAGLVEALREQCEALGYRCGIPVRFEIGELPPDGRLPPAARETLFRTALEALSNVAHHARARSVLVRLGQAGLEEDPAALLLEVRDDGQGFDPASRPEGPGLRSLRESLEAAGGALEVDSAPGLGTDVRARMPLAPPEAPKVLRSWMNQTLVFAGLAFLQRDPPVIMPLLALFWVLGLSAQMSEASAKAGKSALGTGLRLAGRQHRFLLLALVFWWTSTLVPTPPRDAGWYVGWVHYRLEQTVRFAAPLALVLALRDAWELFRLRRSPRPAGLAFPPRLFAGMLLVFLASLPCLLLLPDPWAAARFSSVFCAILYLGWWLRNLP